MDKIIVTPRSLSHGDHPVLRKLRDAGYMLEFPSPGRQPTEDELVVALKDAVGYLAGVEQITARTLAHADKLVVISRNGTGIDNIDLKAAEDKNIVIKKADGANARGVAELALGLILAAARSIPYSNCALKAEQWKRREGFEVEGKTLGVIGCGKIGKLVASFGLDLGMKVLAFDMYPNLDFQPAGDFGYTTFENLLQNSDIVSLHCPPTSDKKPLLGSVELGRMKRGAVLINTARQSLVDDQALKEALEIGQIQSYALDAFDHEPPTDYSLIQCENVISTPHIGGFTRESVERAAELAVENLLSVLSAH